MLKRAAGRLLLTRAMESAAVCATILGGTAALIGAGWILARVWPVTAAVVCVLAGALGALPAAVGAFSRRIAVDVVALGAACALCAVAGVLAGVVVVLGWHVHVPLAALCLLMPLGALVGAAARLARGVSLLEAGVYLDVRFGLREQLSTAAELHELGDVGGGFSECVRRQASEVLRAAHPWGHGMWRRTRATAGAAALVAAVCVTLALVPARGRTRPADMPGRLAASLETIPGELRRQLSGALREAATETDVDPQRAKLLAEAANAAMAGDKDRLEELLRQLEQMGLEIAAVVPTEVLAVAGAGDGAGVDGTAAIKGSEDAPTDRTPAPSRADEGARVRVYAPEYVELASEAPGDGSDARGGMLPFADAWDRACAQAADALATGRVPHRHRAIVRNFFRRED